MILNFKFELFRKDQWRKSSWTEVAERFPQKNQLYQPSSYTYSHKWDIMWKHSSLKHIRTVLPRIPSWQTASARGKALEKKRGTRFFFCFLFFSWLFFWFFCWFFSTKCTWFFLVLLCPEQLRQQNVVLMFR